MEMRGVVARPGPWVAGIEQGWCGWVHVRVRVLSVLASSFPLSPGALYDRPLGLRQIPWPGGSGSGGFELGQRERLLRAPHGASDSVFPLLLCAHLGGGFGCGLGWQWPAAGGGV